MKIRKDIVHDNSTIHVYFRCSNKQHFLEPLKIKKKLLSLMAKYKTRYGIKIFDFCLMDNHAHFYMWTPTSDQLGNLMRTVLSQVADLVNEYFDRDSQVFRSRYQSRMIVSKNYGLNLIKYIYANRVKVGGLTPDLDPFCSASWRLKNPYIQVDNPVTDEDLDHNRLAVFIDDYVDKDILRFSKSKSFLRRMIDAAIRDAKHQIDYGISRSAHFIGSPIAIAREEFRSRKKSKGADPPVC